jgi:NADPH2:quinone reductase
VADLKAGDRVMASAPGGFGEYAVTDWGRVHRIPANNMTYEQATCFPVALQTMHNAVVTAGRFKPGETLLVQGASSGVGLMGMQIGKLMDASLVIGTSTNAQRRARLKEFSCDLALDSGDPKWPEQVKEGTGGKGVDLIVDIVSGGVANQNLEVAALLGRIVNVGRLGGMTGEFNFDLHALKRIDYIGVIFRTRSLAEIREINRLMRADLWPTVEAGKLSLPILRDLPPRRYRRGPRAHALKSAFRQDRDFHRNRGSRAIASPQIARQRCLRELRGSALDTSYDLNDPVSRRAIRPPSWDEGGHIDALVVARAGRSLEPLLRKR